LRVAQEAQRSSGTLERVSVDSFEIVTGCAQI